MDIFYQIVSLLGGLALFLYGMRTMGDGLKGASGGAMNAVLAKVTDKPVKGFILGLLVTCMIQSSTATIVLTVGLVGAGFLTYRQSIGIVFGANVGTAITAQIIRLMDVSAGSDSILYFFKSDNLAPVALIIGIIMIMFIKKRASKTFGTVCIGFGVLFVGLMNMSSAVAGLSDSLSRLLVSFEDNYFLGFLSGVIVTGIIQSSSAVIGILQSIASSVGLRFCAVFAVIIGVNIGDCLTTYLVCRIGANREQVRVCMIHIIYNVCAAILLFAGLFILRSTGVLDDSFWYATLRSGGVANVHGLFRLVPALLFLPLANVFSRLAAKIVPEKVTEEDAEDADIEKNLRELDPRLVINPRLALLECEHLLMHMADVAVYNYEAAVKQVFEYDDARSERIAQRENLLDRMADASNKYILAISPHIILEKDNRMQSFQYKALTVFERIGDLAVNINDNATALKQNNKTFSDVAIAETGVVTEAINDILDVTIKAFKEKDMSLAFMVEPMEEVIDEIVESLRERHTKRMVSNKCDIFSGIQFQNLLQNLERISDQCSDLGVYLLSLNNDEIYGKEHDYIHNLHQSNSEDYLREFNKHHDKYFGEIEELVEAL